MARMTEKPTPPESYECCGGGSCSPCVWDRYYDLLREWQEQQGEESALVKPQASTASAEVIYR